MYNQPTNRGWAYPGGKKLNLAISAFEDDTKLDASIKFESLQLGLMMMILHCTCLVPRRLSLDENVRVKEGGN